MCCTCLHLVAVLTATLLVGNTRGEQLLFYDFNDASDPAVAVDSSGKGNDGAVISPAAYTPGTGGRTGESGDRVET